MSPLQENILLAANRISEYLSQHQKATSWQLKVMFRVSSSVLYLALGSLYQQGKIHLEADGIDYHVTWVNPVVSKPAQPLPPQNPQN